MSEHRARPLPLLLTAASAVPFAALCWFAWQGRLGFAAIGLLLVSFGLFGFGRRSLPKTTRTRIDQVAKLLFTVAGVMALLRHRIAVDGGDPLPIYEAISAYIGQVQLSTFLLFAAIAMAVKFMGVIASAWGWHLLMRGQGVRYPFWSFTMTGFLIGRFIGTFLPSTIGLDGYTLYEAGRYSNQWPRVITAKALEKFIGVTGLFLGMVLTMPFGYQVIVDVTTKIERPEAAPLLAGAIALVAGGVSAVVVLGLVRPGLLEWATGLLARIVDWLSGKLPGPAGALGRKVVGLLRNFVASVGAYRGKVGLLMQVLVAKFITHFTTAVVYFFTALAIGVVGAQFWPIVFGSNIQILATLLSPTIAGEGAREAFQLLLLSEQIGGAAAVLSGALGFIAAEAATMWGGAFLWVRKPGWRPGFCTVDGKQVDYAWIDDSEEGGFSAEKLAEIRQQHA